MAFYKIFKYKISLKNQFEMLFKNVICWNDIKNNWIQIILINIHLKLYEKNYIKFYKNKKVFSKLHENKKFEMKLKKNWFKNEIKIFNIRM